MSRTRIGLSPVAGFCVKSSTVQPSVYTPPISNQPSPALLEPPSAPVAIPAAQKVFINIAWDNNVPPPPDAPDSVIHSAVQGEPSDWYVPVVVSEPRFEPDKGTVLFFPFLSFFSLLFLYASLYPCRLSSPPQLRFAPRSRLVEGLYLVFKGCVSWPTCHLKSPYVGTQNILQHHTMYHSLFR